MNALARGAALVAATLLACADARAAFDCVVSATGVAFGTYDPLAATANDSVGEVKVVCTHLSGGATRINYTAALSPGSSGRYPQRLLRSTDSVLGYNLFVDLARSRLWGDGTGGTSLASGAFTVGPGAKNGIKEVRHAIYGRIPALQDAPPGAYADTIVVTLTF